MQAGSRSSAPPSATTRLATIPDVLDAAHIIFSDVGAVLLRCGLRLCLLLFAAAPPKVAIEPQRRLASLAHVSAALNGYPATPNRCCWQEQQRDTGKSEGADAGKETGIGAASLNGAPDDHHRGCLVPGSLAALHAAVGSTDGAAVGVTRTGDRWGGARVVPLLRATPPPLPQPVPQPVPGGATDHRGADAAGATSGDIPAGGPPIGIPGHSEGLLEGDAPSAPLDTLDTVGAVTLDAEWERRFGPLPAARSAGLASGLADKLADKLSAAPMEPAIGPAAAHAVGLLKIDAEGSEHVSSVIGPKRRSTPLPLLHARPPTYTVVLIFS